MANPYTIIAALGLLLAIYGSGFWTGHRWAEGEAAIEAGKAISDAVEQTKVESSEQMKVAVKNAERRSVFRVKQQKLEQEIAKDETAKTCHVSAGVVLMLNDSINTANATAAGGINGGLPVAQKPAGFFRSNFSSMDWLLGAGLPRVQPEAARLNGLDQ